MVLCEWAYTQGLCTRRGVYTWSNTFVTEDVGQSGERLYMEKYGIPLPRNSRTSFQISVISFAIFLVFLHNVGNIEIMLPGLNVLQSETLRQIIRCK